MMTIVLENTPHFDFEIFLLTGFNCLDASAAADDDDGGYMKGFKMLLGAYAV